MASYVCATDGGSHSSSPEREMAEMIGERKLLNYSLSHYQSVIHA